jgi:hypothetical protein
MLRYPVYLSYGLLLLTGLAWAQYRGWTLSGANRTRVDPRTVRDNPGSYRSTYGFYPHYVGGK